LELQGSNCLRVLLKDGGEVLKKQKRCHTKLIMWPIIADHENYMERLIDQDSQVFIDGIS
jgi:hypothetical protein